MVRKKSVQLCAQEFRRDARILLGFCRRTERVRSDAHVSFVHDAAVIKLYTAFERMMVGALTGAINNDTRQLSVRTHVRFPKHLTDEVYEYIITGGSYFNFRGRDGLISEIKKYVRNDHYLVDRIKDKRYAETLERLCALRTFAAHDSKFAKQIALKSIGQQRMKSSGSWLKRQDRFTRLVDSLLELSKEIEAKAPF